MKKNSADKQENVSALNFLFMRRNFRLMERKMQKGGQEINACRVLMNTDQVPPQEDG